MVEPYTPLTRRDRRQDFKFRDFKETGAEFGLGRGPFRRLRAVGAFDPGSPLRSYNPYLPEGQSGWQSNPLRQFSGPAGRRMSNRALASAIGDIYDAEKVTTDEAYRKMLDTLLSGQGALQGQAEAVSTALRTPARSTEALARAQAVARERIAREGGTRRGALAAALSGQGQRVDDANAAYAAMEGDTLYRLGQAEIEELGEYEDANRQGLLQAITAASGYTQNLGTFIDSLLSIEEFRKSLTADEVNALLAIKGLKAASS